MGKGLLQKMGWAVDPDAPQEAPQQPVANPNTSGFPKTKKETPLQDFKPTAPVAPKTEIPTSFDDDDNAFGHAYDDKDESAPAAPSTPVQKSVKSKTNPHVDDTINMYDKGFAQMNKDGIDFYEFYVNITTTGNIDNPALYQMAFNMHQTMNPAFTKESVLADAESYMTKIEEAYSSMKSKGNEKKNSLLGEKTTERSALEGEIDSLESKIRELTAQLNVKKLELGTIDTKYANALEDVSLKLEAHDIAKDNLIGNIQKVVRNINQTIK